MARTKLTQSNRARWAMALPGFGLISMFIILPFIFAFVLSFTNQRLISPNPTAFVSLSNDSPLLGMGVITLGPERGDSGAIVRDEDGAAEFPRLRGFTRNNDNDPHLDGMREWFSWGDDESRTYVLARDIVFIKALVNTFLFVIVVAPCGRPSPLGWPCSSTSGCAG